MGIAFRPVFSFQLEIPKLILTSTNWNFGVLLALAFTFTNWDFGA